MTTLTFEELEATCPVIEDDVLGKMDREDVCAICLDVLVAPFDHVRKITKCGHHFHNECLHEWCTKHNAACPVCRAPLVEEIAINILIQDVPGVNRQMLVDIIGVLLMSAQ